MRIPIYIQKPSWRKLPKAVVPQLLRILDSLIYFLSFSIVKSDFLMFYLCVIGWRKEKRNLDTTWRDRVDYYYRIHGKK